VVILVKVADLATDVGYRNLPEPARALSIENRGATKSPATMEEASPPGSFRLKKSVKSDTLAKMANRSSLKIEYREEADIFQVTVVEEDGDIVRKIPADGVLRVIENIERMLGNSIDTKA
jgi:uncharacterized FlaG/YvyC family protein